MKVEVMKITVVDERGTCDQRNDAAAAAELEFTILQPITHQHAGILQKNFLSANCLPLCQKQKQQSAKLPAKCQSEKKFWTRALINLCAKSTTSNFCLFVLGLAMIDIYVFKLNEYFVELNPADFKVNTLNINIT